MKKENMYIHQGSSNKGQWQMTQKNFINMSTLGYQFTSFSSNIYIYIYTFHFSPKFNLMIYSNYLVTLVLKLFEDFTDLVLCGKRHLATLFKKSADVFTR